MPRHLVKPNKSFAVSFELMTCCYEMQAGNHLVLAIDTCDLQYQRPTKDDFKVTFFFGEDRPAMFDVPMIPADNS